MCTIYMYIYIYTSIHACVCVVYIHVCVVYIHVCGAYILIYFFIVISYLFLLACVGGATYNLGAPLCSLMFHGIFCQKIGGV